jgi:hypothetical protein
METNMPASRTTTTNTNSDRRYLKVILTANAVLLGVLALNGAGLSLTSVSRAEHEQPRSNEADEGGRVSAAEQRKTMIAQLATLTQKVERLESLMARGVPVRVMEMPAGFSSKGEAKADEKDKDKGKPEGRAEIKARPADGGNNKK